jgi:hypothetical protein
LPVPGSTTEIAEATPDGSSTGTPAFTSPSANAWRDRSRVVVMVRPPRYSSWLRASLVSPKAGLFVMTFVT